MTRQFLREVCRALIGVVLLAQMAISAYACPGLAPAARMQMGSAAAVTDKPGDATAMPADRHPIDCANMAGPMDADFANLCAAHCHHGQQSDQAATLAVPGAMRSALYSTPPASELCVAPRPAASATSALVAASPPLAILHCCFRI